jgi:cytochrome c oxidase subunit III
MSTHKSHPFHIVDPSPWPISLASSLFFVALGAAFFFHGKNYGFYVMSLGLIGVTSVSALWWRDVIKEGRQDKAHSSAVQNGLRIAMALFILSEVAFFFAFFWSFFKAWLVPADILDGVWAVIDGSWPPEGIKVFDPWDLPFFNTLILLLSGTTVTWAHYALEDDNMEEMAQALGITVLLGFAFTLLQIYEYHHAAFKFTDGIYASNFYMATGFHGVHVFVGTIFLLVNYCRAKSGHFKKGNGYLGFEFAAWYWHFVDVVWLFLFVFLYVLAR